MSVSINRDEWLKALSDAGVVPGEDDQGAVTVLEFAAMFTPPLVRMTATRHLEKLVTAGKAVKTRKRSQDPNGRFHSMVAYRLVP